MARWAGGWVEGTRSGGGGICDPCLHDAAAPIHLDTSFLIRALVPGSAEAAALGVWITEGRPLAMSAVAWGELLCGTLEADHEALASAVIRTIVPLDAEAASLAASLFNAGGRRRGSFPDCLVAVTCVRAGAALATANPTSGASQARGRSWSTHRMSSGQGEFPNARSAVRGGPPVFASLASRLSSVRSVSGRLGRVLHLDINHARSEVQRGPS